MLYGIEQETENYMFIASLYNVYFAVKNRPSFKIKANMHQFMTYTGCCQRIFWNMVKFPSSGMQEYAAMHHSGIVCRERDSLHGILQLPLYGGKGRDKSEIINGVSHGISSTTSCGVGQPCRM